MQGRFKRDGSAAAEQEPRGGTDRGSSPQHAQHTHKADPASPGDSGDRAARPGAASSGGDGPKAPPKAKSPTDTGSRIALRNWRISTRLVSLLTLPVVAATTLGGLRINESMADMKQLDHMQLLTNMTKQATDLAQALQAERDLTAGPLANNPDATDFKVTGPREVTNRARKAFLEATRDIPNTDKDDALESIRANANQIAVQVNNLGSIRETAYQTGRPHSLTVENYHRLIESLLSLSQDMAQATSSPEMIKRTRALAAFSSAKEYASMQRAIIAAALPGGSGSKGKGLEDNDRLYGKAALENGESSLAAFESVYESSGGNAQELTDPLDNGNPTIEASEKYAKRVLDNSNGLASQDERSFLDWTDDYGVRIQAMRVIESTLLGQMEAKARELREESQRDAIINGALILLVLGVSLVGAFVVARSMIRSLRRLQDTATKVAQDRLPDLVKQLSESDPQDVDTSVESVGVHSRDEIGKVAAAFDDVHREAVRLAAEQALLRGNVNAMFTNLSRRSQGLIQRQLSLISELESREADPDQLSSLFKLDHLATRMRRNGENLLVLAGEEPGRRWTRPVPLVDVLRAAASEVEQYERIELAAVPATEVAGRVVNDLVHLLAELLENATSFSSPQTKVRVTGHALPDGRVLVEIHDTGIGLSPEDLAAINERLASPPTVDVSVSRRMGLFVVGRLSLRHGIRIQLRPSDSGGTTALVMLPVDVAHGGKKAPGSPGGPGNGQGAVPPGPGGPAGLGGRPGGGPGGTGGGSRPGLGGGPGGAGAPTGGRIGTGAPRGQVGAGSAPRAALPGRDGGPGQGQPGQGRQGGGLAGAFGSGAGRGAQNAPARGESRSEGFPQGSGDRGKQLPGGPRAELPGAGGPQRPPSTSWGSEQPPARNQRPADAPRGHEDNDRGAAATAEFARPDFNAPPPQRGAGSGPSTGQFVRPDVFGPTNPAGQTSGGGFQPPRNGSQGGPSQDPASTGQFARPDLGAPQPPAPGRAPAPRREAAQNGDHGARRPNALPPQPQPEALPPATGPGDGRTPLYDTLETNWFHGGPQGRSEEQEPSRPASPAPVPQQPAERPAPPMPQRTPAAAPHNGQSTNGGGWRSSPNDELVRQAERVRKPAAGGVTTSGLPRRVPRANLVAGTAQEQNTQTGPQVSRAPNDVRGRLTNLRRGIQQGRQQNSTTGSFNLGPTHQQER
ncbi:MULTISPECIES: sensor histidine kinase [Streptomyces]|uniref:Nitrate- and nitrite sensing domain-containing protein n=1 Tax=Streptomyces achmelvichensis TaxID=3134111 RepID=A0ACC6Q1T6_9ACTN|nr:nitrate- and nitrite sensing domain-containing protein [Streptomyces sp. NBC_01167]